MKKTVRILLLSLLIAAMLLPTVALAATESNAYISYYSAKASKDKDGNLRVDFGTQGNGTMEEVGAYYVDIYNTKTGLVRTFSCTNENYRKDMLGYDTVIFYGHVTYQGVKGNSYYAIVTHYGAKNGGSGREYYTTETITL